MACDNRQFHGWRAAQAVCQQHDTVACAQATIFKDRGQYRLNHRIGWLAACAPNTWFAVNAKAEFHFTVGQ